MQSNTNGEGEGVQDGGEAEHKRAVERVLERMLTHDLAVNLAKSEFHVQQVTFLGYILGTDNSLRMEPGKIDTIQQWKEPTKKKEVQAFLGFANYYRRFIYNYAKLMKPLTQLTKAVPFSWGQQQQEAFDNLKQAFQEAPILAQFDRGLPTVLETDASNQAISGVLSQAHAVIAQPQPNDKLVWKLVDCHVKTLTDQQRNWPITIKSCGNCLLSNQVAVLVVWHEVGSSY